MESKQEYILSIKDLKTQFRVGRRLVKAVDGVSLNVRRGKTLGLVGESGCGKSVTAHSIMQLLPKQAIIPEGEIIFRPQDGREMDIVKCKRNDKRLRDLRGRLISMIFQDPMSSLNPVYRIGDQIVENIRQHEKITKKDAMERAIKMLETLGIPNARERVKDYPHQFSGGMKQRVMIALGMICNPELLIADEPTTALDVTIQAQILELMQRVQQQFNFTIIIITHNMGIVADMADDIAVMYMGKIVEFGTAEDIFLRPSHPYTKALLKSVPVLGNGGKEQLEPIRGQTPDPSNIPEGCAFRPRCDFADERCTSDAPNVDVGGGHMARCWLYERGERHD
ncbi:ABC transporter ATP-binding protein [Christensenellaceae bacterium OttesenSCG-928-M15]|nr:ABC transporter ATP-binding protein [Christensenellaceae bacterium OttesenSCG-928-M15]